MYLPLNTDRYQENEYREDYFTVDVGSRLISGVNQMCKSYFRYI